MTLIGLIIAFCIIPSVVDADCLSGNWTTRVATDGNTYGYQVLARDWLNFYEARALCLGVGGDVASIHSNAENEFVRQLAAPYIIGCQTNKTTCGARATTSLDTVLSVVWLGMHRCQYFPSYNATVDCINSDGTPCDYAATNAVILTGPSPFPWAWGNPSGSDSGGGAGLIEDCVSMYNATTGEWNDLSCFQKLGGVVCKRNCTGTCGSTSIKNALITSPSDITDTSCTSGNWTKRTGEDGNTYGYRVVMKDWLNFYEANAQCLALGAEVVSVHSAAENEFIRQLAGPYITACQTNTSVCASRVSTTQDIQWRSLWLGLHRCAFYPTYNATVDCINSDGTSCDYLNITGGPSGTETGTASGQQEACAAMYSATTGQWNDIACFNKLGGVICKKNCSNACGVASTTTTQLTTTTTQQTTTTTQPSTTSTAEPTTTTTLPTTTTTLPTTTTTLPTTTTTEPSTTTTLPTTTTTIPTTTTTLPTTTTTLPTTTTTLPTTTTTLPTTTTTLPTTTTTLPTTTTTLPTTTTTLPTTTTTLPTTTTTLPTTTTTLPTTTTTLPTTTTTLPTTTTTLPTTTTTLPTTTTTLPTTTTPPINCADCSAGQSKVIYEKNTLLSNQTINNLAATECIYNCKDKDVSQACYNPSTISVVRIRCTDSTKFCVCTSDKKGCFTVTQSAPLYQADYLIYANASYTFLALNTGASQIKNIGTGKTYDFQSSMTFIPNDNTFLNAQYLAISCNGCNLIHNNGMDVQKPC